MSHATLQWEVRCESCFKRSWYWIKRYPQCKPGVEKLLRGDVECSCNGSMTLRVHQKKRFEYVYGSMAKAKFKPRRMRMFSKNDDDDDDDDEVDGGHNKEEDNNRVRMFSGQSKKESSDDEEPDNFKKLFAKHVR